MGRLSPTTLRFTKILADLEFFFGSLDGCVVSEIGVGYGGQANLITSRFDVSGYHLFDLSSVNALARRYLESFDKNACVFHDWGPALEHLNSDLCISNYALSEMTRDAQETYFRCVIDNARSGYVLWNEHGQRHGSMTLAQFIRRLGGPKSLFVLRFNVPIFEVEARHLIRLIVWSRELPELPRQPPNWAVIARNALVRGKARVRHLVRG